MLKSNNHKDPFEEGRQENKAERRKPTKLQFEDKLRGNNYMGNKQTQAPAAGLDQLWTLVENDRKTTSKRNSPILLEGEANEQSDQRRQEDQNQKHRQKNTPMLSQHYVNTQH